jgi:hypothetical protein
MGGGYSAQYTTVRDTEKYYQEDAPRFREEGLKLFGEKCFEVR